ncbi:MAG TPA: hypothetical protein VFM09_13115 [Marmoricola sp.]|nr:hypothetical protein [Marmoricola sp.]
MGRATADAASWVGHTVSDVGHDVGGVAEDIGSGISDALGSTF